MRGVNFSSQCLAAWGHTRLCIPPFHDPCHTPTTRPLPPLPPLLIPALFDQALDSYIPCHTFPPFHLPSYHSLSHFPLFSLVFFFTFISHILLFLSSIRFYFLSISSSILFSSSSSSCFLIPLSSLHLNHSSFHLFSISISIIIIKCLSLITSFLSLFTFSLFHFRMSFLLSCSSTIISPLLLFILSFSYSFNFLLLSPFFPSILFFASLFSQLYYLQIDPPSISILISFFLLLFFLFTFSVISFIHC